ncbi:class I adenylate-forming enzyme family protein [Marmoricola sp. URHB0036]|uniref:class I adenylate-forming enzyme family protein n=1 Tax=Marmoricola sp. URHB0036 TaxID=1298863 RepID=UPI0003FAB99F|nr:AMP-binding protein [Marmoricola sp. URHB0036]
MDPHDLAPGDRVVLLVPGSVAYAELVISLLRRGVFPVPMDVKLTASERAGLLADLDPALVVTRQGQLEDLLAALPDDPSLGPPRGRPIHLTSGTTGRPKGVFSGLLDPADAEALVAEERELWGFCADDVNLVLSPLHHSAPLRFAMGTLLAEGRVALPGQFDPATATATIVEERPTSMFCVPAHLQRLFAHWDEHGSPDLSCFRLVAHAGAPCPEWVKRRLIEEFPAGSTWEFYGSTEGQFTACRSEEWLEHPGTLGRARPGREMTVDEDGHLWCVVPAHARFSYFGDPGKTAGAWRGPAFTVGDLGRIDEDGYVYLDGRREDLIISGGVNVYPAEVEQVLGEVAGVDDIAVYGVDDEQWGQRVCAAVVGAAEHAILEAHARAHLAPAKRPKEYHRLDSLPRTPTGKVRRLDLPDLLTVED